MRKADKTTRRLNQMIENAIHGAPVESGFDETEASALETKLSHYLAASVATKAQLTEEREKIHALVSDISHQTKTPVTNILLYAQLLKESALPQKEQQCVQLLAEQAEKLNFLIGSLVKSSRLETGMIQLLPKSSCLQPILREVAEQAEPKAKGKGVRLSCGDTAASALFDPGWTKEALYNLVDNAIKYTPKGGSVCLCVKTYELFARIDIADTGMGIAEGEMAKIFARFYRGATAQNTEGVGIGLYLAREIVSGQGGYIKVQSSKGKGSTFSVFLPLEQ